MKRTVTKVTIDSHTDLLSFSAHPENGKLVVDECKGVSPQDAIGLFPDWVIESITKQTDGSANG